MKQVYRHQIPTLCNGKDENLRFYVFEGTDDHTDVYGVEMSMTFAPGEEPMLYIGQKDSEILEPDSGAIRIDLNMIIEGFLSYANWGCPAATRNNELALADYLMMQASALRRRGGLKKTCP